MTATQRAVVDDLGNINVHGRSALEIVWQVKDRDGNLLDLSASDLFVEIDTKLRIALVAGEDNYSPKLRLTRAQVASLPLNKPLDYALHDETPSSPATIWSGKITAYGFRNAPAGADAVEGGAVSWTGATVTVQQGESVPTVVVTYMGATGGGVPTGGTAGQLPFKNSGTNYDLVWRNAVIGDVTGLQAALDAKQAAHANLTAFSGLSLVADSLPYANGTGTLAMATLTAAGRALLDDVDAAAQRVTMGVVIGTDVQAQNARLQDIATNLSATSGAIEKTGANTFGTFTVTAAGKALIDDADAPAQRTTLGLGTAALENIASMAAMTMAGVLAFVAGTAALPGLAVAGDLNTGVYGASADVLGFTAGGVGRVTVSASGIMPVADATYDLGAASTRFYAGLFSNSVKIGGAAPAGAASLSSIQSFGQVFAMVGGDNVTDATIKNTRWAGLHYTNSEKPMLAMLAISGSAGNEIRIGGGTSAGHAATNVFIYTAANNVTPTGTARWYWSTGGHYWTVADNSYDIGANGSNRPRTMYLGTKLSISNASLGSQALDVWAGAAGVIAAFQSNSVAASGQLVTIQSGNAVTGSVVALYMQGAATGNYISQLQNSDANGGAKFFSLVTGAGDPFMHFEVNGVTSWSHGIDNSDSDAYVISQASLPGTNNRLRIATDGVTTLYNNLLFGADNSYDIGALAANRPRNGYFAGNLNVVGQLRPTNILLGTTGSYATLQAPADGVLLLNDGAGTSFVGVKFGLATASFPYLKVNGANLQSRLGNDSDFNRFQAKLQTHANAVAETPTATHTLVLYDAAGTAYRVLALV